MASANVSENRVTRDKSIPGSIGRLTLCDGLCHDPETTENYLPKLKGGHEHGNHQKDERTDLC